MRLKLPLDRKRSANLISGYVHTITNLGDAKEKFYEELAALISTVPQVDKLLLLGDFNAYVGQGHQPWEGGIGTQGGKCNSNDFLQLRTCATHGLAITKTMFRLPTHNKTSWMHPHSKHWQLINYIIVRANDRQDVRVTKAMCGAHCWTDHHLISSKIKLHIHPKRRPQGQTVVKKLNVNNPKLPSIQEELSATLESQLTEATGNDSDSLKTMVPSAALQVPELATRSHQDWLD